MKILGLTDMVIKEEQLGKVLKETFPEAERAFRKFKTSGKRIARTAIGCAAADFFLE